VTVTLTLVGHSLRRRRSFLIAAAISVFLFQILVVAVARELELTGAFAMLGNFMPEFMRQWTNMVAGSFAGMVMFGHSHPIVILLVTGVVISVATDPAEEIESKFVDLLLARPISRRVVINRSIAALLMVVTGVVVTLVLGTTVGLATLAPVTATAPKFATVLMLAANLALVACAWGGIALAVTALSRRRSTAVGISSLLVFGMYVLDYIGRFWEPAADVARVSPFHYYSPFQLIGGQAMRITDAFVLVAFAVTGAVLAHVWYGRRDL
jgi:ABC-2 type transport system permease protein